MNISHAMQASKLCWDSMSEEQKRKRQEKMHAWMKAVPAEYWKRQGEARKGNSNVSAALRQTWVNRKLGLLPARRPKGQGIRRMED